MVLERIRKWLGLGTGFRVNNDGMITWDYGDTVPTATTAGYAIGCFFQHRDGGTGTSLYVNEGTESSCAFRAVFEDDITGGSIALSGDKAIGLDFDGTYTNAAIDLTSVVLNYSGSSGPVMIRAGTYGSPVTSSDPHQSGMIRLYGKNTATTDDGTGFYDRGIFVSLQVTGNKGAFPISGLVEVRSVGAEDGPTDIASGQFIVGLHEAGAKLAAGGFGMFGSWFKVYSAAGSEAASGTVTASIWLDSQTGGTMSGEEYAIFATTGGGQPDAFIGFETTGAGWANFLSFDETAYDQDPVGSADIDAGTQDRYLKVNLNGTAYGIPMYHSW